MKAALRTQMTPQGKLDLVPMLHFIYTLPVCCSSLSCLFTMSRGGDYSLPLCRNDFYRLNPLFLRPSNPFSFYLPLQVSAHLWFFSLSRFSVWVHLILKCSAQTQLAFLLPSCQGWAAWKDYLRDIAGSVQDGVHLFLWQGVTAGSWQYLRAADQNAFLKNFSLSSFLIQCLYSGLCLSKDSPWHLSLGILFFSDHFLQFARTIWILILVPILLRSFTAWCCLETYEHTFLSITQASVVKNQTSASLPVGLHFYLKPPVAIPCTQLQLSPTSRVSQEHLSLVCLWEYYAGHPYVPSQVEECIFSKEMLVVFNVLAFWHEAVAPEVNASVMFCALLLGWLVGGSAPGTAALSAGTYRH